MRCAAVLAWLSLGSAFGAGMTPYGLECEARRNPAGIDSPRPRLSWKLKSDEQAQQQTAYQIVAASAPEKLLPGAADWWDSGRVASSQTTWIPYGGASLRSFQRGWWKVRVWDRSGAVSAWSEAGEWTTAVLDPRDWRAYTPMRGHPG